MARHCIREPRYIPPVHVIGEQPDLFGGPTISHATERKLVGARALRAITKWAITPWLRGSADQKLDMLKNVIKTEGLSVISVLPDLRRSGALSERDLWQQIVIGGVLESQGMVSFRQYLSAAQAEAIRAYVNSRAATDKD